MSYGVYTSLVPVRQRSLRLFSSHDPWNGGKEARWSLTLFKLVQEQAAGAAEWAQIRPTAKARPVEAEVDPGPGGRPFKPLDALGLETDGAYRRMLPRVLQTAWANGVVGEAFLPGILAALEPELKRRDFFLRGHAPVIRKVLYGLFGALMVLLLVLAGLGSLHRERISHSISRKTWLAQPQRDETVDLQGGGLEVHPISALPLGALKFDPALTVQPASNILGWYQASGGKRLVLYQRDRQTTLSSWAEGPVVKISRVGLSAQQLMAAGANGPAFDRRYILIDLGGWRRHDPAELGEMRPFLLGMSIFPALALVVLFLLWRNQDRHERHLLERISKLASATSLKASQ